jgi:hypothetical protein
VIFSSVTDLLTVNEDQWSGRARPAIVMETFRRDASGRQERYAEIMPKLSY